MGEMDWRRRRLAAHGMLAGAALVCVTLLVFPPAREGFYPACPIYAWLGVECPGCGATRALAALLHGRLMEAVRLNALFVGLLPFGVGFAAVSYLRAVRRGGFRWPRLPVAAVYGMAGAAVVFTVARNLR
jgi:hypothetical protein